MNCRIRPERMQFSNDHRHPLTRRQLEILPLLAAGKTDKEMAADLRISEETVGHHLRIMYQRYGVHCRAALIASLIVVLHNEPNGRDTYTNV
jgi:DNA-binding NarL/FixJ family response regulator